MAIRGIKLYPRDLGYKVIGRMLYFLKLIKSSVYFWIVILILLAIFFGIAPFIGIFVPPGTLMEYWQLIASLLAVFVATIFGSYAVKQVRLGRLSLVHQLQSNEEANSVEVRQILMALYYELDLNRQVALYYEGCWLHNFRLRNSYQFSDKVWNNLLGGPIWRLPSSDFNQVYHPTREAYQRMRDLSLMLQPPVQPVALALAAVYLGITDALRTKRFDQIGTSMLVAIIGYAFLDVYAKWNARHQGYVTETRKAIEAALMQIRLVLYNRPIHPAQSYSVSDHYRVWSNGWGS